MAVAAVAIFAIAGGIAYASIPDAAGVINGCYRTSTDDQKGQLRVVEDPANCRSNEQPIQWSQRGVAGATGAAGPVGPQGAKGDQGIQGIQGAQGPAGADGQDGSDGQDGADGEAGANGSSPTVAQLPPGNGQCDSGGVAITDAAGTTAYVCSGARGPAGQGGADGEPFSGTFTSPNGQYSISVTDTGVVLMSPDSSIRVSGTEIRVASMGSLTLRGSSVNINGGTCFPAARVGDFVTGTATGEPGPFMGNIASGSPSVCIG